MWIVWIIEKTLIDKDIFVIPRLFFRLIFMETLWKNMGHSKNTRRKYDFLQNQVKILSLWTIFYVKNVYDFDFFTLLPVDNTKKKSVKILPHKMGCLILFFVGQAFLI